MTEQTWAHDAPGVDERGLLTCTIHSDCVAGIMRPKPETVLLLTVGDMTGIPARPVSAGRHLARDHWMKRLFLRGR